MIQRQHLGRSWYREDVNGSKAVAMAHRRSLCAGGQYGHQGHMGRRQLHLEARGSRGRLPEPLPAVDHWIDLL